MSARNETHAYVRPSFFGECISWAFKVHAARIMVLSPLESAHSRNGQGVQDGCHHEAWFVTSFVSPPRPGVEKHRYSFAGQSQPNPHPSCAQSTCRRTDADHGMTSTNTHTGHKAIPRAATLPPAPPDEVKLVRRLSRRGQQGAHPELARLQALYSCFDVVAHRQGRDSRGGAGEQDVPGLQHKQLRGGRLSAGGEGQAMHRRVRHGSNRCAQYNRLQKKIKKKPYLPVLLR